MSPYHIFSAPGTYEVSVDIHNGVETFSLSQTVEIFETPIAYQAEDLFVCNGESIDLNSQNASILNGQSSIETTLTYHLSPFDANNGSNPIDADFMSTLNPQNIYALSLIHI